MRMIHRMVLVEFPVPVLVRAGFSPGKGCLGKIRLAIRTASG
jgi:hypothetical protein